MSDELNKKILSEIDLNEEKRYNVQIQLYKIEADSLRDLRNNFKEYTDWYLFISNQIETLGCKIEYLEDVVQGLEG